jgi:4-hydroxybenzoate polyprenyltransferase
MGQELLARLEPLRRLFEADRAIRWTTFAAVPFLWIGLAWADPRFLVAIPLACFAIAASHRFQPIPIPPPDDDTDLL